ncbi:L-threonylcarbamoyladenylate synthase [Pelagovum pacificum]|uniref:Threonylcarbamoyl-AMP synthase n=1 Tax=Pelagovum pacificum TaxID=2588711 RepID=A0A5C5GFY7_9RHOB|nr:L-threonylcarbamoyladenylate synthase [Pelagovum pacificum]QQA43208.1 threonylcarbamoyl-AMP synthase [Pelagovum pacificum]TNY33652.1 threonylcarbamoyl-AMP synthase [Pelagovum pacificum]
MTRHLTTDDAGLAEAAALLGAGEIVALPTETVYGLAADARNGEAVARVYRAKGRPAFNPLIVHVADAEAAAELVEMTDDAERLAAAFWPGALTMVLPLRDDAGIAPLVTAGLPTLGVRVPDHPAARALLRKTGPLAAPSANLSGRISPTSAEHVLAGLDGKIAAVLDGGPCPVGLESTIVGLLPEPTLLRAGGLPVEALERCLGTALQEPGDPGSAPISPGQLSSHYAPAGRVRLAVESPLEGETYLGFGPHEGDLTLSRSGDLVEAAAALFGCLHQLDAMGATAIAVAPIPDHGLGRAINDRLRRAAAPR